MSSVCRMPPSSRTAGSRLSHGYDQADRGEHVADAHALGLRPHFHDRAARGVHLPGDLPTFIRTTRDGFLELTHHLLECVTVAVVKGGNPRRRQFLVA